MERLEFDDYEEFACVVLDTLDEIVDEDEFNDIAIIAKYEDARRIIKELLCIGCDLYSVDIHDVEWDGYDDEYIVSVTSTDDGYEVWCEPFLRESGYINDDSNVIYILDNCSSKAISHCEGEIVYEVSVGEESECDGYGCKCDCDYSINGRDVDKETFDDYTSKFAPDVKADDEPSTTSKVEYKINGRKATKEEYEKALSNIEDMYLDNIRDMLLRYSDFMDDYNDLLRMFY